MSNKNTTTTENNENLCPVTRKRIKTAVATKTTPHSSWKFAKLNSTPASDAALTNEYLEEMGIGMLDSEESSSSATSALALVVSTSADENSNEATPNLDAPKFCHQRMTVYRSIDHSLDITTDNANNSNSSFVDPNDSLKCGAGGNVHHRNNNDNSIEGVGVGEKLPQHKKVAILGVGAGLISATQQQHQHVPHQHVNSPSAGTSSSSAARSTRSPLATVACNSYFRNASNIHQQQLQLQQQQQIALNSNNSSSTPHAVVGGTTAQNAQRSHSPSLLPSTSRQAALWKQQQQLQQTQKQPPPPPPPRFVPNENFFLFRNQSMRDQVSDGCDHFCHLSDEILLQIFQWLPKKTLLRCGYVSRRFSRCAGDETLWARLDLGGRALRAGALENVLSRGVAILRLAQTELIHPVFSPRFLETETDFQSKLQYLDLSMSTVTKPSLRMLLSRIRLLKKLSLEHVAINDDICNEIAKNTNLEALNLAMCVGLEAWSVRNMLESLQNLNSLNISWTALSVDAVTSLVTNVTPNLMRLNVAGCRKTMFDSHLSSLTKRCTQLLELDLSDCTGLTGNAVAIICNSKMLEYLSLSRCYLIPASALMQLHNLPTLTYLDVFGMLSDQAMELLERSFPNLGINKFIHSSVARPTVGTRRTSIWGLRTRD